jgi:di/tricarboxylate transporter
MGMKLTKLVAAATAMSLAAAPVVAQAGSQPAPVREGSAVSSSAENLRGGFIIPLIAVVAIILGILAMTGGNNDRPHSP